MKKIQTIMTALLITGISLCSYAQIPGLPYSSSTQTIVQELGLGKVTVTYSRPNVKGRTIFGVLVPYGKVWRTGANTATTITLAENVTMEGRVIPAGTYALFCIPEKDKWTIILNKAAGQWGAYAYDQGQDLLRFTIQPGKSVEKQESFAIQFENATTQSTDLILAWDQVRAAIHLQVDDDARIIANIEKLLEEKEIPLGTYFAAIQYYTEHGNDLNKAFAWIDKAKAAYPERASFDLFKSRMLLRKGDKAGARVAAEAGLQLATKMKDAEYISLNQQALAQAK